MKVREIVAAMSKAKNQEAEVDVIDTNGDYLAEAEEVFTIDEDADGSAVHIVVGFPKL